jgi:hypothetical protein
MSLLQFEHQTALRLRNEVQITGDNLIPKTCFVSRRREGQSPFAKAICLPRLPQNWTLIHLHEFKGFVEISRADIKSELQIGTEFDLVAAMTLASTRRA